MRFATKVRLMVLLAAIIPMTLCTVIIIALSGERLVAGAEQKLQAVRELKVKQLHQTFDSFRDGLVVLESLVGSTDIAAGDATLGKVLPRFMEAMGYYDIFVIDQDGFIVYTVAKESDYQTNILNGKYAASNLSDLVAEALNSRGRVITVDFASYAPSNNQAAAFMGKSVELDGKVWVLAVQLPIDKINSVMVAREGMGATGESYLVGSDFKMRSDSFLDPTNRNITASFAGTVEKNGVKTSAVEAALKGEVGVMTVIDYNGNPVVSAYGQVLEADVPWALMVEMDVAEVMAAARQMTWIAAGILLFAVPASILVGSIICRVVLKPLGGEPMLMCELTREIADGHLRRELHPSDKSSLMGWLSHMQQDLRKLVTRLIGIGHELESAAARNSAAISQADTSMQMQAQETEMLASAIEEMSCAAVEISQHTAQAADAVNTCKDAGHLLTDTIADVTHRVARDLDTFMQISNQAANLDQDSQRIASILDLIAAIAEQTNLLALNAAIEAARAGDQGRGFAVVADEVRQLASKVQLATKDIAQVIDGLMVNSSSLKSTTSNCEVSVRQTREQASLMQQQVDLIDGQLDSLQQLMAQTAVAAEEQTSVSATLACGIGNLSAVASENSAAISEVAKSTRGLLTMASELSSTAAHFKV